LHKSGPYAEILHTALAYERGDLQHIRCHRLELDTISDIYMRAAKWSLQASGLLQDPGERAA